MLKNLKCPYCGGDLSLIMGYTGADWDTKAGKGSGFGHEISLDCFNEKCAIIIPLVHVNESYNVSVVKEGRRHFVNTNM